MDKYTVKLYEDAFLDIDEIYACLAIEKLSPEIAKKQTDRIWNALKGLESMPGSHQDRLEGAYAGRGYKQLLIDNFLAVFRIDEAKKTVYVVTVQHQSRNI